MLVLVLIIHVPTVRVEASNRSSGVDAHKRFPGKSWLQAPSPEDKGWSSEKLQLAKQYSESIATSAVMIVDDGIVVDQWGETTKKFNVHSIRKSFLSALYGIAVEGGKVNLNSTLQDLDIDDNEPSLTQEEKQARVIDLLKARSGIYHPALAESPGMKARKPKRSSHPPRSFWYYNNWDFNALGTIFEKATKSSIFQEFQEQIAQPLQMEDFELQDGQHIQGPDSIHPAYPFRMTARDMARFGLLFLRKGNWRGRQLISRRWVEESTTAYSVADGDSGYGYSGYGFLWWVAVNGNHIPYVDLPDGSFSARGFGGQFIVVIPTLDLVIVHRVNTDVEGKSVSLDQFGRLLELILEARNHGKHTARAQ
jgi:CubicO group peptidase (beta-lactamase class C family)